MRAPAERWVTRWNLSGHAARCAGLGPGVGDKLESMSAGFEVKWLAIVCGRLDCLFEATGAGFSRSMPGEPVDEQVGDMLWEADPMRFAERYPESWIVESYGDQWPAPCIDYWIYIDVDSRRATFSIEGFDVDPESVALTGDGSQDAERLRKVLASAHNVDV